MNELRFEFNTDLIQYELNPTIHYEGGCVIMTGMQKTKNEPIN
jgi:hypothetical protein